MDSETWARLSEWHNTWLDAAPDDRERMQRAFVAEHPALEADVRDLVSAGPIAPGFLETFALALTLRELADDAAPLAAARWSVLTSVVALIASGGMGQVYRATDVRWAATSRSSSSRGRTATIRTSSSDSCRRRASPPRSTSPTSCACSTSAFTTVVPSS